MKGEITFTGTVATLAELFNLPELNQNTIPQYEDNVSQRMGSKYILYRMNTDESSIITLMFRICVMVDDDQTFREPVNSAFQS